MIGWVLIGFVVFTVEADVSFDTEKHIQIERLIELSGSAEQFDLIMDRVFLQYRSMMNEVPEDVWPIIKEELNGEMFNELMRSMIPVYAKHYSMEDIQAQIDFYESPAGQRMVKVIPEITDEVTLLSIQWAEKLNKEIQMRIQELGKQEAVAEEQM
ncbi:MAG: hypothetical protein CMF27_00350 [Kiritimatiellaceae bacterium]|nr:hypothetical protein [Kiritimatiellaceae bacterium]